MTACLFPHSRESEALNSVSQTINIRAGQNLISRPYLDNFSGWVIYVSLVALSIYPNLWQTFRGGDDCLLFRKRDFEDPDHSGLLKALERCQSPELRDLVEFFKIALYS